MSTTVFSRGADEAWRVLLIWGGGRLGGPLQLAGGSSVPYTHSRSLCPLATFLPLVARTSSQIYIYASCVSQTNHKNVQL